MSRSVLCVLLVLVAGCRKPEPEPACYINDFDGSRMMVKIVGDSVEFSWSNALTNSYGWSNLTRAPMSKCEPETVPLSCPECAPVFSPTPAETRP